MSYYFNQQKRLKMEDSEKYETSSDIGQLNPEQLEMMNDIAKVPGIGDFSPQILQKPIQEVVEVTFFPLPVPLNKGFQPPLFQMENSGTKLLNVRK